MNDEQPSRTALSVAYMRGAHQLIDARPLILDDPIAVKIFGSNARQEILEHIEEVKEISEFLRSFVVLRSRFAEDRLKAAVERGVSQYVLLGAGYDTFALRQPEWAKRLTIIEVDHPATQNAKQALVKRTNLAVPSNVRFISVNFEQESVLESLERNGISAKTPTFFSWLGVTAYLTIPSIEATLKSIASFPSGSEVVIDFRRSLQSAPPERAIYLQKIAEYVASLGEPFVNTFEPDDLRALIQRCGFPEVGFLEPDEAIERYYTDRPKDIPLPQRAALAYAIR